MTLEEKIALYCEQARKASFVLGALEEDRKNHLLRRMADHVLEKRDMIRHENQKDLSQGRDLGLSEALLDRLALNDKRIQAMAEGLRVVCALRDPVGQLLSEKTRPNGLVIKKVSVPIGVIAIIYESRPNVTVDAAGLCLKSGNAIILKGGKEAFHSNQYLVQLIREVLQDEGINPHGVTFIDSIERDAVNILLGQSQWIDMVIPRGGEGLIRTVTEHSRIPVLKHYHGVCHVYVDQDADVDKAKRISINAKVQRPGVCNAMETLLVDEMIAPSFLPDLIGQMRKQGVEIRGCDVTKGFVSDVISAEEEDWKTEYLDLILSIRVVHGVQGAIEHINQYGSKHSEAIITENEKTAETFMKAVDAATVYVNASTRFTDGFEFGMGAEMGISTDKLHARGPVALDELTTYKYFVYGSGQIKT